MDDNQTKYQATYEPDTKLVITKVSEFQALTAQAVIIVLSVTQVNADQQMDLIHLP